MIYSLKKLKEIAEVEYWDIVVDVIIFDINELRIILKDNTFIDVWYSLKLKGRYSYHWDRRHIDGLVFRHDNAPHKKWDYVTTFPKHCHDGSQENVVESSLSDIPEQAIRQFLALVRRRLINMRRKNK